MNKELSLSYKILKEIYFNNAYSSIELNKQFDDKLNFGLVTKIVYGVLDNDVKLNYFLNDFINNKTKKQAVLLLKIASYIKLEVTGIPDFAMCNEIVNISKSTELKPYSGFINAVAKKIVNSNLVLPPPNEQKKHLSIKYSKPMWFIDLLFNNLSRTDVLNYLEYQLSNLTNIRINTLKIKTNEFIKLLEDNKILYNLTKLKNAVAVDYESLLKCESLKGYYVPQGIPSMIVSQNVNGLDILDACSAPGGKAVYIATLNPESLVVACDMLEHRVKLVDNYVKSVGVTNIKSKLLDATVFNKEFENKFDCILLDVPCSGLGVINKKPDILLNVTQNELKNLPELQYKILENNAKYLKPNGHIVYSTCTINKQENENVINKFLKQNKNFCLEPVETFGINAVGESYKTFLPHVSQTEGFFIGRIRKND